MLQVSVTTTNVSAPGIILKAANAALLHHSKLTSKLRYFDTDLRA